MANGGGTVGGALAGATYPRTAMQTSAHRSPTEIVAQLSAINHSLGNLDEQVSALNREKERFVKARKPLERTLFKLHIDIQQLTTTGVLPTLPGQQRSSSLAMLRDRAQSTQLQVNKVDAEIAVVHGRLAAISAQREALVQTRKVLARSVVLPDW